MEINELIQKLKTEIKQTQNDAEQARSLERLKEIARVYKGDDEIISSFEIAERLKQGDDEFKILVGCSKFDNILKGFRLKQLITISGITKHGKTSFCIWLTTKMREFNPLWFPLEEGADELIVKFLERGEEPPLFYTPKSSQLYDLKWIEAKIIESIAKYGTKVVFIDQLDFMISSVGENHHLKIAEAMRDIKQIAKKWNIIIFLICHLKKAKLDTNPDLNDLRGSGSIAQESDTVIIIWRETKREKGEVLISNNTNVSIQANRRIGKTGNVRMVFQYGKFTETDHIPEHQNLDEVF
jgi:replicative DNA helicase